MKVLRIKSNSKLKGRFRITTTKAGTKEIVNQGEWQNNLISNADGHGHNLFIRQLFGDVAYALPVTRGRFGTVNTAPVEADADINTPFAYDIEIALREYIGTTGVRITFFAPSVFISDNTYYTFATYCGTQTFSMSLLDIAFVKVGNVDTTIEYEYYVDNV